MHSVVIGTSTEFVALKVLRRAYPDHHDYWDGNWVDAEIEVRIAPWSGTYSASLRTDEFVRFREAVERMNQDLRGSAGFYPMEPWIELLLELDVLGHIKLSGRAAPEWHGRYFGQVGLSFELGGVLDQTFLPPLIAQLREVEVAFPVVGRPTQ